MDVVVFSEKEISNIPSHLLILIDEPYKRLIDLQNLDSQKFRQTIFLVLDHDQVIGTAIIKEATMPHVAQLIYLKILETSPLSQSVSILTESIISHLKRLKIPLISYLYDPKDFSLDLSSVLVSSGWNVPEPFIKRLHFISKEFNPKWLRKNYTLPSGYTIFPWPEITSQEKSKILFLREQNQFDSVLDPLFEEDLIQNVNSLGLRFRGDLVGWMVTHTPRDKSDTIRYSSLFIEPEHQGKGVAILLLIEANKKQQECSQFLWAFCEINQLLSEPQWMRFIEKRLAPNTSLIEEIFRSYYIIE